MTAIIFAWHGAARNDHMYTVAAMQSKGRGFERGIPLVHHWAMLFMDVPLTFLVAYLVGKYGSWQWYEVAGMLAVGLILSFLLHLTYIAEGRIFPDVSTYGGALTAAGWLHFVYMGLAFGLLGLFYILSRPSPFDVWMTTIYLVIHVIVGVHVPVKLIAPPSFPYRGIWDVGTLVPIFGTVVATVGLSLWALR